MSYTNDHKGNNYPCSAVITCILPEEGCIFTPPVGAAESIVRCPNSYVYAHYSACISVQIRIGTHIVIVLLFFLSSRAMIVGSDVVLALSLMESLLCTSKLRAADMVTT